MSWDKTDCSRYIDGYCDGKDCNEWDCLASKIPGITAKTIYITKDNKRFDTIKEAQKHIENVICQELDNMVKDFVEVNTTAYSIDRKDQIALVTYLHKRREKLMAIFAIERED